MATPSARRGISSRRIAGRRFTFIKTVKTRSEVSAFKKRFGIGSVGAGPFAQHLRVFPVRGGFEIWGTGNATGRLVR